MLFGAVILKQCLSDTFQSCLLTAMADTNTMLYSNSVHFVVYCVQSRSSAFATADC